MLSLDEVARFRLLNAHLYAQPWLDGFRDRAIHAPRRWVGFLCRDGLVRLFMTTNLPRYLRLNARIDDHFFAFPGGPCLRRFFKHHLADKCVGGSLYALTDEDIERIKVNAPYTPT